MHTWAHLQSETTSKWLKIRRSSSLGSFRLMSASSFSLNTLVNRQAWPLADPFRKPEVDTGTKEVTSAGLCDFPRRPNPFISTPLLELEYRTMAASPVFETPPPVAVEWAPCPLVVSAARVLTSPRSEEAEVLLLVLVVAEVDWWWWWWWWWRLRLSRCWPDPEDWRGILPGRLLHLCSTSASQMRRLAADSL